MTMGPQAPLVSLVFGVLRENLGNKARRAGPEPRVPRATKDTWGRWAPLEIPDPLVPQALKGPGAA